jgi:streptogramin lyase
MTAKLDGSSRRTLVPDQSRPTDIAADDGVVVWANALANAGDPAWMNGAISKVTLSTGEKTNVLPIQSLFAVYDIALYNGDVFYGDTDYGLRRVSLGGVATSFGAEGVEAYSLALGGNPTIIYYLNLSINRTRRVSMISAAGGSTTHIVDNESFPYTAKITVRNNVLFWTTYTGIRSLALDGGSTPSDLATGLTPDDLASDATGVYWTNATTTGSVMFWSPASGVVTLASNQGTPSGITLTASYVYWANRSTGQIMRLAK